ANGDAAFQPHLIAVACGDVHVAPRKSFAAYLHEHVRAPCFDEHGALWNSRHAHPIAFVEHGRAGLADEQFAAWVLNLELRRQGAGLRVDHSCVVPMLRAQRNRIGTPGDFERDVRQTAKVKTRPTAIRITRNTAPLWAGPFERLTRRWRSVLPAPYENID